MDEIIEISEALELNQQAATLIGLGKINEALAFLEKARILDPMEKETYYNFGNIYANSEDYDKAEEYFRKIILIDKKEGQAYFNIGNIYLLQDKIEKGVEFYNKAIINGFDEAIVYNNLGMVYAESDNPMMAIRNYTKAISKEPLNPEYRLRQIMVYIEIEKYQEALEALEELNQYCPDIFEGYYYRFEIYLAMKDYEKAEEVINNAVELFPKDVSLLYNKIRLESIRGNFDKALEMISEAEVMEDFEIEARNFAFEKAKIYGQKEDMESTIKFLEETVSYEEGTVDLEARYFLMNAYLTNNNYEKLLENAIKVIESGEENSYMMSALYYRALSYKKLDKKDESEKYYKEALKILRAMTIQNPENLDGFMFRILCHKDMKEFDKALELIDYLLMLKEDSGELYALKSSIYKDLGNDDDAEKYMSLAKKYNGIFDRV